MTITEKIRKQIASIKTGTTFTYKELSIKVEEYQTIAKIFERFIKQGLIKRVSSGVFYKPKQTPFGELAPSEIELLKPYLFKNSKRIAYITGTLLYNKMGLTTQIPNDIKIASRGKRIYVSIGNIKATPVKSYIDVTESSFKFLELLDAIKDFNKIPDLNKQAGVKILSNSLKKINQKQLLEYALEYPPRVRAFLGALLENIGTAIKLNILRKSLNPFSEYSYSINNYLKTAKDWNLK